MRVLRRRMVVATLVVIGLLGLFGSLPGCENPIGASCEGCASGVYWDASADRCRNPENGQFVKSCCCD